MSDPKKKSSATPILVVAALAVLIGIGYATQQKSHAPEATHPTPHSEETAAPEQHAAQADPVSTEEAVTPDAPISSDVTLDVAALAVPRILGNSSAPVKIAEHSSFTCGACSAFHKTNFKQIKAEYIDTGKAYIVFDDFPRNAVDITVGALARCIEGDGYFNFVQLMFETQEQWAKGDFKSHIKQNAMVAGLSEAEADACMNSEELMKALADNRQKTQDKFGVNATPTLIINDSQKLSGLSPYEMIKKAIEDAAITSDAAAPTVAPAIETSIAPAQTESVAPEDADAMPQEIPAAAPETEAPAATP